MSAEELTQYWREWFSWFWGELTWRKKWTWMAELEDAGREKRGREEEGRERGREGGSNGGREGGTEGWTSQTNATNRVQTFPAQYRRPQITATYVQHYVDEHMYTHIPFLAGVGCFLEGVVDEVSAAIRAAKDFGLPAP